jgi:hypothetical protein
VRTMAIKEGKGSVGDPELEDFNRRIEEMERRLTALKAARDAYVKAVGGSVPPTKGPHGVKVESYEFTGMDLGEAIRTVLRREMRPQTREQLVQAIYRGGVRPNDQYAEIQADAKKAISLFMNKERALKSSAEKLLKEVKPGYVGLDEWADSYWDDLPTKELAANGE